MDWLRSMFFPGRAKTSSSVDLIWYDERALLVSLPTQVQHVRNSGGTALVTSHFTDELGAVVQTLQQAGIPFEVWPPPRTVEATLHLLRQPTSNVLLVPAQELPRPTREDFNQSAEEDPCPVSILVLNHHPMADEDEKVLEFATGIAVADVTFLTSLDHPLFRHFGGANVQELLKTLGMDANEVIQSPIVDRQVKRAQRHLSRKVQDPRPAESAEEWFEKNLPAGL